MIKEKKKRSKIKQKYKENYRLKKNPNKTNSNLMLEKIGQR